MFGNVQRTARVHSSTITSGLPLTAATTNITKSNQIFVQPYIVLARGGIEIKEGIGHYQWHAVGLEVLLSFKT